MFSPLEIDTAKMVGGVEQAHIHQPPFHLELFLGSHWTLVLSYKLGCSWGSGQSYNILDLKLDTFKDYYEKYKLITHFDESWIVAFDFSDFRCIHKLLDCYSRCMYLSSIVDSSCNVSSSSRTLSDMPESILMFGHCYNICLHSLVARSTDTWFVHRFSDRTMSALPLMRMSRTSFDILGPMLMSNIVFPTIANRARLLQ